MRIVLHVWRQPGPQAAGEQTAIGAVLESLLKEIWGVEELEKLQKAVSFIRLPQPLHRARRDSNPRPTD